MTRSGRGFICFLKYLRRLFCVRKEGVFTYVKTGYVYDKGARDKNEDALLYRETLFKKGTLALGCVCDGMGGMDEGERASSLCIRRIEDFYDHVLVPFIQGDPGKEHTKVYRFKSIFIIQFDQFGTLYDHAYRESKSRKHGQSYHHL